MNPRPSGLTILEGLIALVIGAILVALAVPAIVSRIGDHQLQILSNMRQLHLATQQMVLDGVATTNSALGWPGDTGSTFTNWAHQLVPEYLTTNDLCKLLSAPEKITPPGHLPQANDNAVLVYAVKSDSPGNTVFFTSANFTNTPTGGLLPLPGSLPYGTKGFVIFRKVGDGQVCLPKQTRQTNLIDAYAPLCH